MVTPIGKSCKSSKNEEITYADPYRKNLKNIRNEFFGACQWKNHQKIKNFHMLTPIEKVKHHQKIETFHMVHPTRKVKES